MNSKLKQIKLKGRPDPPESVNSDLKTPEYKKYAEEIKEAIKNNDNETIQRLRENPFYEIYEKIARLQEWKRYKSPDFREIEAKFKRYSEIVKLLNLEVIDFVKITELAQRNIASEEEAKVYLAELESDEVFKLLHEKKLKSSEKYRLPDKILNELGEYAQKVAAALLENALDGAANEGSKTVNIKHLLVKQYTSYPIYPLFAISTPFKALMDRERRRLSFVGSRGEKYKSISKDKNETVEISFERWEYANGYCSIEEVPKKKRTKDTPDEEVGKRQEYIWPNIENVPYNPKLLPAMNRLSSELKTLMGGSIQNLKISKRLKIFITSVVEDVIIRVLLLLKVLSDTLGVKTFNHNNLEAVVKIITTINGDPRTLYDMKIDIKDSE